MERTASPRLRTFAVLAALGLVGGLAAGRPELAALAAPFAVLLAVGLALSRDLDAGIEAELHRERAIEGEEITLELVLTSDPAGARIDIELDLGEGIEIASVIADGGTLGHQKRIVRQVTADMGGRRLIVNLRCIHWGSYRIESLKLRSRDAWGLFDYSRQVPVALAFKVFPESATVRRLLAPVETRLGFGDVVSKQKGAGLEFADLRPMTLGDDPRQINWRVTARGADVWVNERRPERNSDVVLLVDTLSKPRRGVEVTLDLAVRAAGALATGHLRRHDRVGLVAFGEPLRWLRPGMGDVQRYQILDTLMESRSARQVYWPDVGAVPRRALPAKALVIGLSPLLDPRAIDALADLRGRGFDVAVVEISAELFVPAPETDEEQLARRIWELQREGTRQRFLRHGIAIASWDPADPFQHALAEVETFRRKAVRARA